MSENPDPELAAKETFFNEQALLGISDDEQNFANEGYDAVSRALEESKALPPARLTRQGSSFLGLTPKERQAEFEVLATKQRANNRESSKASRHVSLESGAAFSASSSELSSRNGPTAGKQSASKAMRVATIPDLDSAYSTPFYVRVGIVPRQLKNGKNVKAANDIKLEPEHKQLLKGKIIYFYPNDDISMVRRTRIHKVIQLGAAWVNRWRDDVTHIMLDDASYSYSQLLRHLNKAGFPKQLALVKFDPYVPQCIQFGTLLDPKAQRFSIKGAPAQSQVLPQAESSQPSEPSQVSLKIKPSRQQIAADESRKTDSNPTEASLPSTGPAADPPTSSSEVSIVKDSFIVPSSESGELVPNTAGHFDDALSKAIQDAKAIAHLPLDEDEDTDSSSPVVLSDDEAEGTDEEDYEPSKPHKAFSFVSKASALRDKSLNLNTFQCMDPSTGGYSIQNPNAQTIQILEEMCTHYDQMQDHWRTTAYRKAVTTLKKQNKKITTAKQAGALPFIGPRLADKIEEIVFTNRLRKLDNTKEDPLDSVLRLFLGIYGVGIVQANKWIQAGHRTLEDLQNKVKLTESHKIGIEHYKDFNSRIPRAEVAAHGAVVKAMLEKLNPKFEATVMGSYRRGAKDSGDIDLIISCPGASASTLRNVVFDQLIPKLFNDNFLKASLATNRSNDPTASKWHGASCLPSSHVWRRLDLLLVPEDELGAALIYFTGNDIFNRSIRLLANKRGMRLNQRGLYKDVQRGKGGKKLNEGVLVEGRSEKRIFEILGVPWREPHERIC